MESAVRLLREGPVEGVAPLVVLVDTLQAVGGPALLRQAVQDLGANVAAGRAAAAGVTVAALEQSPHVYYQLKSLQPPAIAAIIDCYTDPYGRCKRRAAAESLPLFAGGDGLVQLEQRLLSRAAGTAANGDVHPPQRCIVIDGASKLLDAFGPSDVAAFLARVQRTPCVACLLCLLHSDLHTPQEAAALQQGAAGVMYVQPVSNLEAGAGVAASGEGAPWRPHGRLVVHLRRRTGRVKAESRLFRVMSTGIDFREAAAAAPASSLGAAAPGAAPHAGSASAGAVVAPAPPPRALAGGMRLELTQAEREAREGVRLPYEHQGRGSRYSTADYRDYLPPEAGGRGPGEGRLGHILYIRDTDSEEADSDEDPDDDLDI